MHVGDLFRNGIRYGANDCRLCLLGPLLAFAHESPGIVIDDGKEVLCDVDDGLPLSTTAQLARRTICRPWQRLGKSSAVACSESSRLAPPHTYSLLAGDPSGKMQGLFASSKIVPTILWRSAFLC